MGGLGFGQSTVSVWVADLDGTVREAQNVNQQHDAGALAILPTVIAGLRLAERGDAERDVLRRAVATGEVTVETIQDAFGPERLADEVGTVLAAAECSPMTSLAPGSEDRLITAHDAARLLAGVGNRTLVEEEPGAALESWLAEHRHRDALPLGLPEDVPVGNLTAIGDTIWHDIALARPAGRSPVVLCVLTSGLDPDDAELRIGELARFIWDGLPPA